MEKYDLLVIGGGSGGVRAARLAAQTGARVLLAEKSALGGTCVNVGCVPKKLFVYAASYAEDIECAAAYGRDYNGGQLQWETLRDNKNHEIQRLNEAYKQLLHNVGVTIAPAHAAISGEQTAIVGDEEITAKKILLATGSAPIRPPISGAELGVLSDDMFHLSQLPRRAIVIGGGYIALEFAGILDGFGVNTTICYRADLPLRGFDDDLRQHLSNEINKRGIAVQSGVAPQKINKTEDGNLSLILANGVALDADLILLATGRKPVTANLGLAHANIQPDEKGFIAVNENYQTSCPWVYALGDIISTPALTPVATSEAAVFVARVFGDSSSAVVDYPHIATAVFSRPPLATVGLTESAAKKKGLNIKIYKSAFKAMKRGFAGKEWLTLMKLVVDADSDRVLGIHMIGEDASEIIQGFAVAMRMGATKADFDATVGVHPTSAEEFVAMPDNG